MTTEQKFNFVEVRKLVSKATFLICVLVGWVGGFIIHYLINSHD